MKNTSQGLPLGPKRMRGSGLPEESRSFRESEATFYSRHQHGQWDGQKWLEPACHLTAVSAGTVPAAIKRTVGI